jgi:3',5'-cyclic AMP phosphodiesterase CpdA
MLSALGLLWLYSSPRAERITLPAYIPSDPSAGEVVVAAVGDFGTGGDMQRAVAGQMCGARKTLRFDRVVTTGDNVYDSGDPDDFALKFFEPFECLFDAGVQFRAVLGNHDVQTAGGAAEISEPRFGLLGRYYSWKQGELQFVMLDSNTLDSAQMTWARRTLKRSSGASWTVVVLHHPVHSGGAGHGSTPGLDAKLAPMFETNGVDLVLQGHDHVYSRGRTGGVTYVVTGGGGAALYGCADPLPRPVKMCASEHHFVELRASRARLVLTAVTPDGGMIERIRVRRNP